MLTKPTVYVGLGANLYDPVQKIFDAAYVFKSVGQTRLSSLYLTSPVAYKQQPDFINAVLELKTSLSPHQLLLECQSIEKQMGRIRNVNNQNAARVIDCDVLVYVDEIINTKEFIVPHPRLAQRLFVLEPLCELNANLEIPGLGKVKHLLKQCDRSGQSIIKLN